MCNSILSIDLCSIMKDRQISTTQKFILIAILCESVEHSTSDVVELPIRIMENYGVKGHGHIKGHLSQLQEVGYLEIGTIQREDGYVVTAVRVNRNLYQTAQDETSIQLLPKQEIFANNSEESEDRQKA